MIRPVLRAGALVVALTAVGFVLGVADPRLAGPTAPHPALTGSLHDAVGIFADNARVLSVPFLLGVLRLSGTRLGRRTGDLCVIALIAASAVPVGVALGRWQGRLVPYVPQLPVEWAALIVAASAWLVIAAGQGTVVRIAGLAAVTLALLSGAAALETWATPHRHATTSRVNVNGSGAHGSGRSQTGRRADLATDDAPASAVSLQGRKAPFPSPQLGSAWPPGRR